MRIVTRGDFDGLSSSVFVSLCEDIREVRFVHPKDAQDGKVSADAEDIVINLPYIQGCGLWFDHHVSEVGHSPKEGAYKGRFEIAPSCARVIYNYYKAKHADKFAHLLDLLEATDRLDSAQLTVEDVTHPQGWILLGLTLDPRSGLGPEFRKYFRWLVEYIKELPLEKVINHPEVKRRTDRIRYEQEAFRDLLTAHSSQSGKVIMTDFRELVEKPVGNRFLIYTMYPDANVEMRIFRGFNGSVVIAVGKSIFNRTCKVNIGEMLRNYGGGGHDGAGTTQVPSEDADHLIKEIADKLNA
ncbi:exopolyphosphatase [Planctomycetales bacterium]|nr:exopolyphosphatase [Planctomycetales bacterium]GHT09064.1 exopolyphosphatase [Planctomycetales bacterium]